MSMQRSLPTVSLSLSLYIYSSFPSTQFSKAVSLSLSLFICKDTSMLVLFLLYAAAAAELLQNGDFESPPLNLTENPNSSFTLLTESNSIPGWTFSGTVQYLTAGPNVSLPDNGHAIQLGQNGQINQSFKSNGAYQYILTFTLAPGGENCSTSTIVNVSVPGKSSLFYLEQRYGKEPWESHAWNLGSVEIVNLELRSQPAEGDPNVTCGPVIDTFLLKGIDPPTWYGENLLANGDFEVGAEFLTNSTEGILLDANSDSDSTLSAIPGWSVMGTVKYIDSKHYAVPEGNAAIEIVSGTHSGIQTTVILKKGSIYSLEFVMGDANDSCVGNFILGAQVGSAAQNFTLQSNGTGHAQNFSMTFYGNSFPISISFVSFSESQTREFGFCGPVIDNVVLHAAHGKKLSVHSVALFSCMAFLLAVLF